MPWDVPLLDFFEELGHAISYLDDRKDIEDSLLAEIIFGNSINTTSIEQKCIQMGYEKSVLDQVFVLHIAGNIITNDQIRSYAQTLKDYFKAADYQAIVSCYGDRIIGFMNDCTDKRDIIVHIFTKFDAFLKNEYSDIRYTLNIGEKCDNISKLQKSFHETSKTNAVLEHIGRTNEIVFYDQMGFYRMLMAYENTSPMKSFADEVLGEIIAYEKKAHTQLMETMWTYFECDCNLQRTADKLFSHKNTVKYRLQE